MCRINTILLTGLLLCQCCLAQQNNVWYFGKKAGLNFNSAGSNPIPVGLNNSAMDANEGCSSICDADGNLLFYSNGVTVFNRNHQIMLNGDNLAGNISAVQSCIIVPAPGNVDIYYVFTTDALENFFARGYTYSIINMTGDNGNGEVVTKNAPLWGSCTERMTAARHGNGTAVWLITNDNNSNIFRAWLIDCNGININPVVSAAGAVMDQYITSNNGMIKISPDGKQLCHTSFPDPESTTSSTHFFQLFDFDNITGIISNPRQIILPNSKVLACEYSANSKLLYLSDPVVKSIIQVEPTLPSINAIIASRVTINSSPAGYFGIQLAPDSKIYLADIGSTLGVINKPDIKGTGCNYVNSQVTLTSGTSYLSLPSFINDISTGSITNGFSSSFVDSCRGIIQFSGFSTLPGTTTWAWDFGDGNTSNLQNPVHTYSPVNQNYTVQLTMSTTNGCGTVIRTKTIYAGAISATPDFDFTASCTSDIVQFNNHSVFLPDTAVIRYLWDFDDGNTSTAINPTHRFQGSGSYDIRLTMQTTTTCLDKSIVKTLSLEPLNLQVSPDQEIDMGQTVQLSATGGFTYVWTPAKWLSDDSIANPLATPQNTITYKIVTKNVLGCSDSAYVSVKVLPPPGIYMPSGFTPNNDGLNDLIKPIITKEFSLQEFSIYNRWGQKIFTTSQKEVGWNGQLINMLQDTGVYIWIINATDTRTNKKQQLKGTFTLIR